MINLSKTDFNFFIDNKYETNIYKKIQYILIVAIVIYITIATISDYSKIKKLETFIEDNEIYANNEEVDYSSEYNIRADHLAYIYKSLNDINLISISSEDKIILVNGKSKDIEKIKKYSNILSKEYFEKVSIREIKKIEEEYVFQISCEL